MIGGTMDREGGLLVAEIICKVSEEISWARIYS